MDRKRALGFHSKSDAYDYDTERKTLLTYINLKLKAAGLPEAEYQGADSELGDIAQGLLDNYREQRRVLSNFRCPADQRIEDFLARHFEDLKEEGPLRVPGEFFVLDRHGLAREMSVPAEGHKYQNELISSYRIDNGVSNNPKHDRRTTKGTFHIVEGGLPIPADKKSVPRVAFTRLFQKAVNEQPKAAMELPFTSHQPDKAYSWVTLMLRPLVIPEVPGYSEEKTMEVRFFMPGSLVSNLDFVESIFGNAGDPYLPENDAGLDVKHWTGTTGCIILAPHLLTATKKELGLPNIADATERQKRDGMCWESEDEVYNDGTPFKITCRNEDGVVVTLIADNYFGYCKKEVKTQIGYTANLLGNAEEEHAGGALAFPAYNIASEFQLDSQKHNGRTFADVFRDYHEWIEMKPEGYGVDKNYPDLVYIPENAKFELRLQKLSWATAHGTREIRLEPNKVYMAPSGYKVTMNRHPEAPTWRLVGSMGEGTFCHKPCTVSGGGKSEISKSLNDYMLYGPIFVSDIDKDLDMVDEIFNKNYQDRWKSESKEKPDYSKRESRPVLGGQRSLGSVIKLLTPSRDYTDEYNAWLETVPNYITALVFIIKRFYKEEWEGNWRDYFGVDIVNGFPGHEIKYRERKLVGTYLRVGHEGKIWRTYKLRQDFIAADKVQMEDDITASTVVPADKLEYLNPDYSTNSIKFSQNCEYRLFQRPDDAIHRGIDKQTERDMASRNNFMCNMESQTRGQVREMVAEVAQFEKFTQPMQDFLKKVAAKKEDGFTVVSSNPRLVNGVPTKNPRYLQDRPDMANPFPRYVGEMGMRLYRAIPADKPVHYPVNAVLLGRRNNPADREAGIRPLAVYNPIHFQELPELFMDFVCSLTGKSPSTTGAGSEGAMTKGPFNMLIPTSDLNDALVSYILTGLPGFSSSAGYVGPNYQVGHDLSLLIPELWCRMSALERDPYYMIDHKMLEKIEDFEYEGEKILASRLGYRITEDFVNRFFGRVFDNPNKVLTGDMLRPEEQSMEDYVDGIKNITEARERVAKYYFEDGSIEEACPPLKVVLNVMAYGEYEGKTMDHPELRAMFTREALLKSDWYAERLKTKQAYDIAQWTKLIAYVESVVAKPVMTGVVDELDLNERLSYAKGQLAKVSDPGYLEELVGTIGTTPKISV